jgi:hypothetical protein
VELARVAEAGLTMLEEASRPIQDARTRGRVLTEQAPVHAFTCGGTHLVYALLTAALSGYLKAQRERLRQQMDLVVFRLRADPDLASRFYQALEAKTPGTGWYLLDAHLKFAGHAIECLNLAQRHKLYEPPAAAKAEGLRLLETAVARLRTLDLGPVRTKSHTLYQQLVGDVCHVLHRHHLA